MQILVGYVFKVLDFGSHDHFNSPCMFTVVKAKANLEELPS